MNRDNTLIDYYRQRAREYERIYHKPERQADLVRLKDHLRETLSGHRILELACGTGYWTAAIAEVAESVYALDASDEVLEIARAKGLDAHTVSCARGDAFAPPGDGGAFTAGFAGFWWSHIPVSRLPAFLGNFHAALLPGARGPLDNGTSHEVLKNFPSADQLRHLLQPYSSSVHLVEFDYFWCATYDLPAR